MLVKQHGASRITIGRAMRELQQRGLIDRVAGSGSYVRGRPNEAKGTLSFGLLIPDLGETEIFEPVCYGIANAPDASEHILLWGHADAAHATRSGQAWQLCEQYVRRKVDGVFFAPLEFEADAAQVNRKILSALEKAQIPVVLLDRRPGAPEQHRPDLVGINNRQTGYVATEHLIRLGCRRIGFLAHHGSATTISQRFAGYRDALTTHGLKVEKGVPAYLPEEDVTDEDASITEKVEAFVCLNDRIAAQLMGAYLARGIRIPEDIRIVGIDDANYAALLPVPLTTVRQPCRAIGEAALAAMLDRIDRPHVPTRDILLDGELVVRKSCGMRLAPQIN
jgi:DNA-binding LacI/PurR family transcriptional regulator